MPLAHRTEAPQPLRPPGLRRRFQPTSRTRNRFALRDGKRRVVEPSAVTGGAGDSGGAPPQTDDVGGARVLLTDARVAFLLLNHARYRTMERLFGLPREQVNVATVVAGLLLTEAVHARGRRMLTRPKPSAADLGLGGSALREGVYAFSGQSPSETPLLGTLIVIGVLGSVARPVLVRALHEIRVSSRQLHAAFGHRYGHLVVRGQRELKRASSAGRDRLSPLGQR